MTRENEVVETSGGIAPNDGEDWAIRLTDVTKAFGPKVIYENLTLNIRSGETLTIMGGSGMGKSVALKLMTGLLSCDSGSIEIFGQEVTHLSEESWVPIRAQVSMLFQGGALFDSLSVKDNIAYPLRVHHPDWPEDRIAKVVAEKLHLIGLQGIEDMHPADLSGGMRKRVGLARAIATDPKVILWDEPTTGLDPINTSRINHLILRMQEVLHVTSVVVTHDMGTAFTVSDRIAFLYDRRIVLCDTAENVKNTDIREVRDFVEGRFEGFPE